jgi:phosphopantothenoylcysteine decarboxylase / phosphopantothenate---cysteine ligase
LFNGIILKLMKTVVVGVSSGIAAYKARDLIKELRSDGVEVFVIMTESATEMIPSVHFEEASGHPVLIKLFEEDFDYKEVLKFRKVEHIQLADKADVMVIVPATANIIAKLAHGIADDFLTTAALALTAPIIVCPSMNVNMWNNPVTQENIGKLKKRGFQIIDPDSGMLACGYEGVGRLADIQAIKAEVLNKLSYVDLLKGKKIIVTAGGTTEKIDDVRYITNRASGKMGVAIAEECKLRGADVLLLRAKTAVKPRFLMQEEVFVSTAELFNLVKKYAKDYHYFYHTAAVSDFTVANDFKGKLSSKQAISLDLKPQVKILDKIKKLNPKIYLIGFKAEPLSDEKELIKVALDKLRESGADAIVANDISKNDRGFEVDQNEVYIVLPNGLSKHLPLAPKKEIAKGIVDYIEDN